MKKIVKTRRAKRTSMDNGNRNKVYMEGTDDPKEYMKEDIGNGSLSPSQALPRKKITSPKDLPENQFKLKRRPKREDLEDVNDLHTGVNRKGRISVHAVIDALRKTDGMITLAAKELGVSYRTLSRYIQNTKRVQIELHSIEENILDRVQTIFMKMIESGNARAVNFYLRCKGKDRGFIESGHHVDAPKQPITFKYQLVLPEGYNDKKLIEDKTKDITPVQKS